MSIVEFITTVQTQKRITIPSRVNVKEGERVLVKIERINEKEGVST